MTEVLWPIEPFTGSLMVNSSDCLSFRLFSFAATDKTFGVDGAAKDSIDAHWDYE